MNGPRKLFTLLALTATFVFGLTIAQPADAGCAGKCVNRPQPGKPFCLKCETAESETGALCQQQAPCVCIFLQCPLAASTVAASCSQEVSASAVGLFELAESVDLSAAELVSPSSF